MAVLPILKVPDERLLRVSTKVTDFGDETQKNVKDLVDTLDKAKNPEGAGVAAPQVGISKRIIVVRNFLSDDTYEQFVLANPKIISRSKETVTYWEGCLSVPNSWGQVPRYKKIKLRAQNQFGEEIRLTASNYFASVIQHEIDHLDGILFTAKVVGPTLTEEELDRVLV